MILNFLLLLKCLLSTQAVIIPSASKLINKLSFSNMTSAHLSRALNGSFVEGNRWKGYCTPIQRRNQPPVEPDDCKGLLEYVYDEIMTDGGRKSREFVSPGTAKTTHFQDADETPKVHIR